MTTVTIDTSTTPMGNFGWLLGPHGVLASGWTTDPDYLRALAHIHDQVSPGIDRGTATAIDSFFAGDARALDAVIVDQHGGEFSAAAWRALRRVPPGRTVTYTELAAASGRPAAVRAAASACATNRVALFVPCHRVGRSDGGLGGFRYGVPIKAAMLDFERSLD